MIFGISNLSFQIKGQFHSTRYPDNQVRYHVVEDLSTRRVLHYQCCSDNIEIMTT